MSHFQCHVIALYRRLLRLYPAQFRAEFGDEMGAVFALATEEADDDLSLLGLLLGELRDLPLSVIRAHIRERREERLAAIIEGETLSQTVVPIRSIRFCTWTLLTVFILYCLLFLVPFFYYNLHLLSWESLTREAITSGLYDAMGYHLPFTYEGTLGGMMAWLSIGVITIGPVWMAAIGGVLGLSLRRHWRQAGRWQRILGSVAVLAAVIMLMLVLSPIGRSIFVWFWD